MWVLTAHLNDTHNVTKWLTQEGAMANRERLLEPRRLRVSNHPPTFKVEWPEGWTAITRESSHRREA